MKESEPQPKTKKGAEAKVAKGDKPYKDEDLIRGLNHPLRRQVLRLLHSTRVPLSPSDIEKDLELGDSEGDKLSNVSYHTSLLARLRIVSLADHQQVRGALEHFYASQVSDARWVKGLLSRTQESDEARLWPRGRNRPRSKAAGKKRG